MSRDIVKLMPDAIADLVIGGGAPGTDDYEAGWLADWAVMTPILEKILKLADSWEGQDYPDTINAAPVRRSVEPDGYDEIVAGWDELVAMPGPVIA